MPPSSSSPVAFDFLSPVNSSKKTPSSSWAASRALAERKRGRPIIAICHLSWDWVWQRPQQFLSRLSETHPVLFVETHCTSTPVSFTRTRAARHYHQVTILEIHLPAQHWSDGEYIDKERRRVLKDRLTGEFNGRFDDAILWFNDPMAVTAYAGQLGEHMIVYDCMDELSQFHGAAPELIERERELTRIADVVFCGGRKMRDKRLSLNPNTHFYGTGVDCDHFGSSLSDQLSVSPEIAELPGKVLGYFGVVDERLDYDLITALADACADWSIAMVGPVAKINPTSLPRRPNLHWLGARPYEQLPAITKGFDVCLMPFAINAATEYINPTKALEYMAAGRPVVATAINEVKSNFSGVSRIARNHDDFIKLCRREARSPSRSRIQRGLKLAADNTWEAITAKMQGHINEALSRRRASMTEDSPTPSTAPLTTSNAAYV